MFWGVSACVGRRVSLVRGVQFFVLLMAFALAWIAPMTASASENCEDLLRLVTLNTQNLILPKMQDTRFMRSGKSPRKPWQLEGMADAILSYRPSIAVLQELENREQTEYWIRNYLNNEFVFYSSGVQDGRGVMTGFLIHRKFLERYEFLVESNASERWTSPATGALEPLFDRDLPILWGRTKEDRRIRFALFGVHLKSKRSRSNDPGAHKLRSEQVRRMLWLADRIKARMGEDFPVILAGDFNDDLTFGAEAQYVLDSGFADSVLTLHPKEPFDRIATFSYFEKGRSEHGKLDGILLPANQKDRFVESEVLVYRDRTDWVYAVLPKNFKQKAQRPSDHSPVGAVINLGPTP